MTTPSGLHAALTLTLAICAALLALAVPASAAPVFDVEITRDEDVLPVVHRSDQRVDYDVAVSNTASTLAGTGDVIPCTPVSTGGVSPSYSYAWRRNGQLIPGETGSSYTIVPADASAVIQCEVRAVNGTPDVNSGGFAATSGASQTGIVVGPAPASEPPAAPPGPNGVPQPAPANPVAGTVMTCATSGAPGPWTGVTEPFGFEWYVNGIRVPGATSSTYTVQAADVPSEIQCAVTGSNGETAITKFSQRRNTSPAPNPRAPFGVSPTLAGGNSTSGTVTAEVELPAGAHVERFYDPNGNVQQVPTLNPAGWSCTTQPASGVESAKAICQRSDSVNPQSAYPPFAVAVELGPEVPDTAIAIATASGGGALVSASASNVFAFAPALTFGIASFQTLVQDQAGADFTEAGAHPYRVGADFSFRTYRALHPLLPSVDSVGLLGATKTIVTETPRGFVGNPLAIDEFCPTTQHLVESRCPDGSAVGGVVLTIQSMGNMTELPIYAMEPEYGRPAQFAFTESAVRGVYVLNARLRPGDGYAISLDSAPLAAVFPHLLRIRAQLCGFGAKTTHPTADETVFAGCRAAGDPAATERPLVTLPPRCGDVAPTTVLRADAWEAPGVFESASFTDPPLTDCEQVRFDPLIGLEPTSTGADSASGLDVEISMPSDGLEDPHGVAQAHLKKTVVELPEGVSVNPSAATGLEGCSDAQLGLGTDSETACPDGSKIASVEATTPVLEETLSGVMVLRTPKSTDPMSGEMLRMALIVRNDERGILVKLPGSATADPQTGRLVATFDDNPELPIGEVKVRLKGGQRGTLAMPQDCGPKAIGSELSPWKGTANVNANPREFSDPFTVGGDCSNGFSPRVEAGMDTQAARANGSFSFEFTRRDGEQWLRGLTAKLPQGLLASVRDVPLCSNTAADAGNCPGGSRIGVVDAKAGSGDPFVLEQKGEVFLTEGYKGGEYGLAVKIRPVAGPFRGAFELSPIVVRQALHVDRTTAQVTAISDPFPLIHHGIPLRVREVLVKVDRDGFMLNPSSCDAKQVGTELLSAKGAASRAVSLFQAVNCSNLAFKPKLTLSLTGKRQVTTGKHPGVKAVVTQQGTSEAGIEQAVVRLPKSLALDPANAQALCEFEDGTSANPENRCPKGSIVGRARAESPLLNDPLVGNVYFVKNVRRSSTGNLIRTLPMIVVALRGEIAINLRGVSSTTKDGKLVNTFASVPDAPITRFNLNINGRGNGILAVTRTRKGLIHLCAKPKGHVAEADMDSHNGRRRDTDVRMKTPCTTKQTRAAKRKASRAAARAKRS